MPAAVYRGNHTIEHTIELEHTADDYRAALEELASGRLPTDLLIEPGDLPLGQLQSGMEKLMAGELAGKVMVVPSA